MSDLSQRLAPASCKGLKAIALGRFLALTVDGDEDGISSIAAACVTELDMFRAPQTDADLDRRRTNRLTPKQDELLQKWGYPHVMEAFRFHMTLTGKMPKNQMHDWQRIIQEQMPCLPQPFVLSHIALVGERSDGRFDVIRNFPLIG